MTVEHHSYLVRIWRDTTIGLAPCGEWQGDVEHIQSGCCWKFKSVEAFLDAINIEQRNSAYLGGKQTQRGSCFISTTINGSSNKERKND